MSISHLIRNAQSLYAAMVLRWLKFDDGWNGSLCFEIRAVLSESPTHSLARSILGCKGAKVLPHTTIVL
ncbi:hypothetical protein CKG06_00620 [Pseudomonas aeruginosa]|nr:hypothetical protein CKG06_00620 [Pseudomonas aeruginosa]